MIDILIAVIIIKLWSIMLDFIFKHTNKNKQHTFIYCPKCENEMIKNGQFIEDNDKPEWLTMEEILEFARKIGVKE